jgi:hypothetical protein
VLSALIILILAGTMSATARFFSRSSTFNASGCVYGVNWLALLAASKRRI